MIRFVRIVVGFGAVSIIVGWTRQALGLEDVAGIVGDAIFLAIALPLAGLSDREFFYGTSPKR